MKKNVRILVMTILSCALVVCVVMMVRSYQSETEGEVIYEEAMEEFLITAPAATQPTEPAPTQPAVTEPGETEPEVTEPAATEPAVTRPVIHNAEEVQVDFQKLKAVNPDIVGWIIIENTTISYPILQGADNEKYLNTTYNGRRSSYGSIFIDYRISAGFDIPHTVIYGHNMRNSSMFGQLLKFNTKSFWQSRRYFHILLPDGMLKYEIFSAYKAQVDSDTYRVRFADDAAKAQFLDTITALSAVDMGVTAQVGDDIVTLSTCTSVSSEKEGFRYVVHGRKVADTRPGYSDTGAGGSEETTEPAAEGS